MAGVTDKPMRQICRRLGAGYAVSEMLASDPKLWATRKSVSRRDHSGETGPIGVQIAGADPDQLAGAARFNVDQGAEIIDINMGCPAKKVLKAWAGSALLRDEALVGRILDAVVAAVDVPVTLKFRTGWNEAHRNGVAIAKIAESAGVAALAVHGRTREQRFTGEAEYETIASIKSHVSIPVIANGDIASAEKARFVLEKTGADGLMIGRAAQGRPWIFRQISGAGDAEPDIIELGRIVHEHLTGIHELYGSLHGVRVARKHIGRYLEHFPGWVQFRQGVNRIESADEQLAAVAGFIGSLADRHLPEAIAA
jgi:tRNA-dihydrouridine synthase B